MLPLAHLPSGYHGQGVDDPDESTLNVSNLEDELAAVSDKGATTDQGEIDGNEPNNGIKVESPRFARRNEWHLRRWYRDLEGLIKSTPSEATHQALSEHALAMYTWVISSVTPFVSSLEAYQQKIRRENERLWSQVDLWRDIHGELLETYLQECDASEEKTRLLGEYITKLSEVRAKMEEDMDNSCPGKSDYDAKLIMANDVKHSEKTHAEPRIDRSDVAKLKDTSCMGHDCERRLQW